MCVRELSKLFPGAAVILDQLDHGASRARVGIRPLGKAPVREGAELKNTEGDVVGRVTSGGFGPSVGGPVAMGYVDKSSCDTGTSLLAIVRNREIVVEVCPLPVVTQR